jgi:DHA1 family bicyclomycin/chloramphenicol resistance-like MFS transporter
MQPKNNPLIIILGALTAMAPFSIDMYLPAFPSVAEALNTSVSTIQLSLASFFVGMALGQLFIGPISDRLGRKTPLYLGLALYILASVACALAPSASSLIAFRFVQAVGGCAGVVIARAVVRDLFVPQEIARVFSLLMLVTGAAPIIAPTIGGILLTYISWRAIFITLASITALILIGAWRGLPETRSADPSMSLRPGAVLRGYAGIFRNPQFVVYVLVGAIASSGMFAYIAGSPFVYIEYFNVPQTQYGWIFGANAFGLISAGQVNRYWLKSHTPEQILLKVSLVQSLAGLLLVLVAGQGFGGLAAMLVLNFIFVAAMGFIFPNTTALAMAPFSKQAGAASALMGSLQFVVAALASSVVSALHNGTALPMTGTMATCGLTAFLILRLAVKRMAPAIQLNVSDSK